MTTGSKTEPTLPRPTTAPSAISEIPSGELIAEKYRITGTLARGGMGFVYRAEQLPLDRPVALKLLQPKTLQKADPVVRQRFFLEASTLGRLKHPNTVTVYDYGYLESYDTYYMAMELVDGRTLHDVLRKERQLTPERALRVLYEIARSLDEAHQLGVVHRDLKPSNIMLVYGDEGETIKVLDFGIAKVLQQEDTEITRDDRIVGSPAFMAPEQIQQGPIDHRTDLYSMGVLLYAMLSGVSLFKRSTRMATCVAHLYDPIVPIAERTGLEVPARVEAIAVRCMQKKPEDRFQDIGDLKAAIRGALTELPGAADWSSETMRRRSAAEAEDTTLDVILPVDNSWTHTRATVAVIALLLVVFISYLALRLSPGDTPLIGEPPSAMTPAGTDPGQAPSTSAGASSGSRAAVPVPVPAPVDVTLNSQPLGAEVRLNDRPLCTTPCTASLNPSASQELTFSRDGHEPAAQAWGGTARAPAHIDIALVPLPAESTPRPRNTPLDIRVER